MKMKLFSLLTLVLLMNTAFAGKTGEELFTPCKACHTLTEDRMVGPGLAGITEKRDEAWLKSWITSSKALIESGDADAIAIFEEFNKIQMQDYDFTDEELTSLINYIAGKEETVEEVVESEGSNVADRLAKAEKLFVACKVCHNLTEDRLVGPGLAGITEKRNEAWLKSWITSSKALIESGDSDAIAIFEEYNKIQMQDYEYTDEELDIIIEYIGGKLKVEEKIVVKEETAAEEVSTEVVGVKEDDKESTFSKALKNRPLTQALFGMSIFLLIGVLFAVIRIFSSAKK